MNEQPLVSAVCVTRNRPARLGRAIECFHAQTYPHRELVVVYESDDEPTKAMIAPLRHHPEIVIHEVDVTPKRSLGELRNIGIRQAHGEYFCQWDDDDWYHAERMRTQVSAARDNGQTAVLLTNWLMFDGASKRVYLSNFRLWEGSILCRKDAVGPDAQYPSLNRMEDSYFVNAITRLGSVYPLVAPALYVYEVHQGNTWNDLHFRRLLQRSQPLSDGASRLVTSILEGAHAPAEASRILDESGIHLEFNVLYGSRLTQDDNLRRYGFLASMNFGSSRGFARP